jgi:voltage-gated potassium channel
MTIVTLSTVGFAETLPNMDQVPGARVWTVGLILLGSGTLLYFASTLTALLVEGDLRGVLQRNRMTRKLDKIQDHIIVCGVGGTGGNIAIELHKTHNEFVAVDNDPDKIERLTQEIGPLLSVIGDASEDHTLEEAGISRAKGLIVSLPDDRDNLYVTLTARALNGKLRIVAKAIEAEAEYKVRRAGADAVVSPTHIGGMRMVSEMLRPKAVKFLDDMLRAKGGTRRIEEFLIPDGSPVAGGTLDHANLGQVADSLVIAIRLANGERLYNPPAQHRLEVGDTLIVMVLSADVARLRKRVGG